MKRDPKKEILNALGVLFIIWGIVAIIYQITIQEYAFILWFCYTGLILIGLGILIRRSYLIASQLAILTIPLIIWNIDFFSFLFTGDFIWGMTAYFFEDQTKVGNLISVQHVFTLPLTLFSLWIIKIKRKSFWILSCIEIIVFFVLSRLISDSAQNLNCAFSSCFPVATGLPYIFDWFFFSFLMIGISTFVLISIKSLNKDN